MTETASPEPDGDKPLSRWLFLPIVLFSLAVVFAVAQFEPVETAMAAGIATASVSLVGVVYWGARNEPWFWPFIVIATIIQGFLVFALPWATEPSPMHRKGSFLLVLHIDMLATLGSGWLAAKLTKSRPAAARRPS